MRPHLAYLLATVEEAAQYLGVAPSTIHRWINDKRLQVFTIQGERSRRVIVEHVQALALQEGTRALGQRRRTERPHV